MSIKLLCIDTLEDYSSVDINRLSSHKINIFFVSKNTTSKNTVLVDDFTYKSLLKVCTLLKPDFIVSFDEHLFEIIAQIRIELSIKGMSIAKAKLLSDKNKIYQMIDGQIPYPATTEITNETFDTLTSKLKAKTLFIKPKTGSGSYETYTIKNIQDYQNFILNKKHKLENYIAQQYIEGKLYHSELVIFQNRILFSTARQYSLPNHLMVSNNQPILSLNIEDKKIYDTVLDAAIKTCRAINFKNGILHSEFFITNAGSIYFIETNARAPGIGLNYMYNKILGISFETLLCLIVCNISPNRITPKQELHICGYYPITAGKIKKINQPILNVLNEWFYYVHPEEEHANKTHMSKAAMVQCWDESQEKINQAMNILLNHEVLEMY